MSNRAFQVRIDGNVRREADAVVRSIGMSLTEAVRTFITRIAQDKEIPMDMKRPNALTLAAIRQLDQGRGHVAHSVEELMDQLNAAD